MCIIQLPTVVTHAILHCYQLVYSHMVAKIKMLVYIILDVYQQLHILLRPFIVKLTTKQ